MAYVLMIVGVCSASAGDKKKRTPKKEDLERFVHAKTHIAVFCGPRMS